MSFLSPLIASYCLPSYSAFVFEKPSGIRSSLKSSTILYSPLPTVMSDLETFFDFLLLVELLSLAVVSSVELPALYVACSAFVSFVVLISYLFFAPVLDVTTTAV